MIADAIHAIPAAALLHAGWALALVAILLAVWIGRAARHLGRHMTPEARRGFVVVGFFLAAMIAIAFGGRF